MKKLLLILLLSTMACFASRMKYTNSAKLDTISSMINLVGTGLGTLDTIGDTLVSFKAKTLNYDSLTASPEWMLGQSWYDTNFRTVTYDLQNGIRMQSGQEDMVLMYNNTGDTISNGIFVYPTGVDPKMIAFGIGKADNRAFGTSAQIRGALTEKCFDQTYCLVTTKGNVTMNTVGLSPFGPAYLYIDGLATNTKPLFPNERIIVGGVLKVDAVDGVMQIDPSRLTRFTAQHSYSFRSLGVGTFYRAGFYEWSATSSTLALGGVITTGQAGIMKQAHVGIVTAGPGVVVGGGQVGLRVKGVLDDEFGEAQVSGGMDTLTLDITTYVLDQYDETMKKFSGLDTFQFFIVSGTPSSASLTFNSGLSKYDDFEDRDFTLTGFEAVWRGGTNSTFDIALKQHKFTGWTYVASGFVPGNGDICRKSVRAAIAGDIANNSAGSFKCIDLNVFVDGGGAGDAGIIIEITGGAPGTFESLDFTVPAVSEELDR